MYHTVLLTFPALMILAAFSDLLTMRIPNWLTIALVLTFAPAAFLAGLDWTALLLHLATATVVLLVGMAMFSAGWMGGGDAKLLAGIALWFGFSPSLVNFLLFASIAGGLVNDSVARVSSTPDAAGVHTLVAVAAPSAS